MVIERRKTRQIELGGVKIGGGAPISIQSMTTTSPSNVEGTLAEIRRLEEAGCEIVRVAVPDAEAASKLRLIRSSINIPLVADIHFDHRLALMAVEQGVDGLRINPGNMRSRSRVAEVVAAARSRGVPIRIGVNQGSVERSLLEKYCGPTPEAMVESALGHVAILEGLGYGEIKISLKASSVEDTVRAYRLISDRVDYPLHLGVTEAGTLLAAAVKSAMAMGVLLMEGIGDTIRVSITGDPVDEIKVGRLMLQSLGLRRWGVEIVSCPTCGRADMDLAALVQRVEEALAGVKKPLRLAIMGCEVNGPGEAREADIGIAGGKGFAALFRDGRVVRRIREEEILQVLLSEVENYPEGDAAENDSSGERG